MSKNEDHKFVTLEFSTVDGEKHSFKLKKPEYRTRKQSKVIKQWATENPMADSDDLLIFVVRQEDEAIADILEEGDVENGEYTRMLREFQKVSDADEVDNPEGESPASSTS